MAEMMITILYHRIVHYKDDYGNSAIIRTIKSHSNDHNALRYKKFKAKKINYNKNPVTRAKDSSCDKETQNVYRQTR